MGKLAPGDRAPAFTLPDQDGKEISLKDFVGKQVVIYFYPKDDTPGCTKEACQLNENLHAFSKADVPVLGISGDPAEKHQAFRSKYGRSLARRSRPEPKAGVVREAGGELPRAAKVAIGVARFTS